MSIFHAKMLHTYYFELFMPNHNKMRVVKLSENLEVIDTPYGFNLNSLRDQRLAQLTATDHRTLSQPDSFD